MISSTASAEMMGLPVAMLTARNPRPVGGDHGPFCGEWQIVPDMIDFVYHESFADPQAEKRLMGQESGDIDGAAHSWPAKPTRQVARKSEIQAFLQYNYARWRLHQLVNIPGARTQGFLTDRILRWRELVRQARGSLVAANMGLVYEMARRNHFPWINFNDLVSEGSLALLRSIDRFDVLRSTRFSTYACRAILASFAQVARSEHRQRRRVTTPLSDDMDLHDSDSGQHERSWQESLETLREIIRENKARLTKTEQTVLSERFGLNGQDKSRTLEQVARTISLSDERVRQLQMLALSKIRAVLERTLPEPAVGSA